jgi:hypothetical protein
LSVDFVTCPRQLEAEAPPRGCDEPRLTAPGVVPALRNLDGSAASNWQHPVALVAAAATVQGAGNPGGPVELGWCLAASGRGHKGIK